MGQGSPQDVLRSKYRPAVPMRGYRNIYEPLRIYLSRHPAYKLNLTFREIERILGTSLPRAACANKAWWSNRKSRLQASAWRCADCRVAAVDVLNREVTFQRCVVRELRHIFGDPVWDRSDIRRLRRHLRLNQTAFAALVGVCPQTVSFWEHRTPRFHARNKPSAHPCRARSELFFWRRRSVRWLTFARVRCGR
jgi:DNA-binding XRE family transcriptional regulator